MSNRAVRLLLVAVVLAALAATTYAVSPITLVSDLLRKTGLSYTQLEGREDIWYVTYTGLDSRDELDVYVWARQSGYVTIYATVFSLDQEPTKSFLWRLLECNDSMLAFKYVIRDDPDEKGSYLVDCQADLPLGALSAAQLKGLMEELVLAVDEQVLELENLL